MASLLLASASPARQALLRSAGLEPWVQVSGVDEDAALAAAALGGAPLEPVDAVLLLAHAKANAVAAGELPPGAPQDLLVLGCDSLLEIDGRAFGKPRDADEATARWRSMRGRAGVLHTGHWVVDLRPTASGGSGGTLGAVSSTVVHFADLSDAEIDDYVATGEPLAVAGAFTVDGRGGPFVTGIEGDHHGVVGLSLPVLRDLVLQLGLTMADLWAARPDTATPSTPAPRTDGPGPRLTTPRLDVRPLAPADAATFAAYRSDPEVARYQGWLVPVTLDEAASFIADVSQGAADEIGRWRQLAVVDRASGRHVGDVAFVLERPDGDDTVSATQARVGVTFARAAQGRGLATEALRALVDHLVTERGVHRVVAECDARNTRSAALLARVGLRLEGHHRAASWWDGEWTDDLVYAVLAAEWGATTGTAVGESDNDDRAPFDDPTKLGPATGSGADA